MLASNGWYALPRSVPFKISAASFTEGDSCGLIVLEYVAGVFGTVEGVFCVSANALFSGVAGADAETRLCLFSSCRSPWFPS